MKDMAMKKKEEYEYHDNDDVNDKTKIDIDSLRITLSVWIFWSRSRSSCFSTPENHIPFFGERTIYITAIGHCLESTRTRRIWAYQIEISAWDWLSWPGSEVFDIITMCRLGKPRDQLSLVTPSKVLPWAVRRVSFHKKVPWRRGNLFSIDLFTLRKASIFERDRSSHVLVGFEGFWWPPSFAFGFVESESDSSLKITPKGDLRR